MATTNYCSGCGHKQVSQNGLISRFCSNCGQSYLGATVKTPISVSPTPQRQSFKPKNRHQDDDEEEELEFPDGLPELRASDVIIEGATGKSRFTKIGELSPYAEIDGPRVKNPQQISTEDFKNQWKVDAGSSRNRVSVEIGE